MMNTHPQLVSQRPTAETTGRAGSTIATAQLLAVGRRLQYYSMRNQIRTLCLATLTATATCIGMTRPDIAALGYAATVITSWSSQKWDRLAGAVGIRVDVANGRS